MIHTDTAFNPPPALAQLLKVLGEDRPVADRQRHVEHLGGLVDNMARFGHGRSDPVRMIQGYLGDRWSSLIMHLLSGGMLRFSELRRLIRLVSAEHGISQRMLTLKLRILERDGIVARHVMQGTPLRVEYQLTALGRGAYEHFVALVRWAEGASSLIRASRRDYDERNPDSPLLQHAAGLDGD